MLQRSLLAATLVAAAQASAQVSILPANPKALDTVRVEVAPLPLSADSIDASRRTISMTANNIKVVISPPETTFGVPLPAPTSPLDIALGQLPSGDYSVEVRRQLGSSAETEAIGTATFTVSPISADGSGPIQDNTDLWYDPAEPGWGLNIAQHASGTIFATWFNYADDRSPMWYTIPQGAWARGVEYSGPIYATTGPPVSDTFDPGAVGVTLVGNARLTFNAYDFNALTASFTLNGKTITKQLRRQGF